VIKDGKPLSELEHLNQAARQMLDQMARAKPNRYDRTCKNIQKIPKSSATSGGHRIEITTIPPLFPPSW
jgi:hypothetical protein